MPGVPPRRWREKASKEAAAQFEEELVQDSLVAQEQRVQRLRQRKHDVEVWDWEQAAALPLQPLAGAARLAGRAMPVAAAERDALGATAAGALIHGGAEGAGAAERHPLEQALLALG